MSATRIAIPGVVAVNTYREAVRDRVLYNLIFFALLMIAAAILVGEISIGIERLVIINLGLSAISIFGLIMAIFIGVGLVYKEMEKRTLYTLLARPVRRWEFLVGKYAGLLLTLVVNTSFMTLGLFAALLYVAGGHFDRSVVSILVAVYFILLELALVTALALFFSCFSSPILSTLFTLGIYITGVFAQDIRDFGEVTGKTGLGAVTRVLYYLLPNFHNFNSIAAASHGDPIPLPLIAQNTLYALLYIAVILLASATVFSRRNLK
jgi:ABC-type transport system involved in multi-copper enzyme maturation permease subunit